MLAPEPRDCPHPEDPIDGISPTVLQEDNYTDVVRELYRLDAGWVVIPDGVRTFHIRRGKIRRQTSHGLITFTGPPPDRL